MNKVCLLLFLTIVLINQPRCWANLPDELDCSLNGGPDFEGTDLSIPAQGELTEGGFDLSSKGTPVSPSTAIPTLLGANLTFSLASQANFQGYLVRVASVTSGNSNGFTFFLKDSLGVGTVSFCSALGLLNTSETSVAPVNALTTAGFDLFFNGGGPFQVVMDVVVTTTAPGDYEYYHSRYSIDVQEPVTSVPSASPSDKPSLSPSYSPSLSPSNSPSAAPNTDSPTLMPTKAPTTSQPTTEPSTHPSTAHPTPSPTDAPFTPGPSPFPTKEPTTPEPTDGPTARPVTDTPTMSPTADEPPSPTTKILSTSSPTTTTTALPTLSPSVGPTKEAGPSGAVQTSSFENLLLFLEGVPNLNSDSLIVFVQITKAWYEDVYTGNISPEGRRLQTDGIIDFSTTVKVRSQSAENNGNTVTYDQSITYREQGGGSSVDPLDIVLSPFEDDALVNIYLERLRSSSQDFAGIPPGTMVAPDTSSMTSPENDNPNPDNSDGEGSGSLAIVAVLGAVVVVLLVIVLVIFVYRYKQNQKGTTKSLGEKKEVSSNSSPATETIGKATAEIIIGDDEVSALYAPSVGAFSYDAEQSMSTIDYDYSKVANGGGNRSVVSSAGGTLGENTRGLDSQSQGTANDRLGRGWQSTSMDSKLLDDDRNNYTVTAPAGKLGVVVDTPDEGAPVIHAVKDTSVLFSKVSVGDRLLKVDEIDVSAMTAVNISRLISRKSSAPERTFTLRKSTKENDDELQNL